MKQTLTATALALGLALTVPAADAAGFGQAGYTPQDLVQADDQITEVKFKKHRAAGVRKFSHRKFGHRNFGHRKFSHRKFGHRQFGHKRFGHKGFGNRKFLKHRARPDAKTGHVRHGHDPHRRGKGQTRHDRGHVGTHKGRGGQKAKVIFLGPFGLVVK